MRSLALLITAVASIGWLNGAEAAFKKAFQSGAWEGTAYYRDDNGAISMCTVRTQYETGLSLSIALQPSGTWALLFIRPEGFSSAASQYSLYADGKFLLSGQGSLESEGQLLRIDAPSSNDGLHGLEHGTTLRVSSSYGDTSFSLKGSADAISELRRCVKGPGQSAFGPGREKDQSRVEAQKASAKTDSEKPRPVTHDQLMPYATEILQNAGFADYRFLPQGSGEKSNTVIWQFKDGSLGSLAAIEKAGSVDLDRYIGEIAVDDMASCKGEFANGKRAPQFVSGAEVRKVFASCSSGLRSFYAEYALVRMPSGLLAKLTSVKSGSSLMFGRDSRGSQDDLDRVTRTEESTLAILSKH